MTSPITAHIVGSRVRPWIVLPLAVVGLLAPLAYAKSESDRPVWDENVTQGALRIVDDQGKVVECPLKHTDARADISGFLARVRVTQTFVNPTDRPIEATYVFPLPHQAAVDRMTMVIGQRRILGKIQRRDEARRIYEQALSQGQTAALLEQERPNIFTQSVGNIPPGEEIRVEISYVDALRYDMGVYEFQFPMVVGPRYNPGSSTTDPPPLQEGLRGQVAPPPADTTRVPDASKINPPILKPGFRNGHEISMSVHIETGVPMRDIEISNHETTIVQTSPNSAEVKIDESDSIPNKDFLMRYTVVGKTPEVALLNHTGRYSDDANRLGAGYFMLMVQPKENDTLTKTPPREVVFLIDVSGSMRGDKTAKVIDAMKLMLKQCRPEDTIQVVTFASQAAKLFDKPVPVIEGNVQKALDFSSQIRGSGGTRMLQGVKLAIDEPIDPDRMRIVVMLTDGFIGNESEIISHVGKKCGDQIRFWAIGIGSAPNMFLIDGVARQGGGLGKQLALKDNTESLVDEIMSRIQRAQLAKVSIDWGDLTVSETYPARIPELWAGRPIIVFGRYGETKGPGKITIRGQVEGEPTEWDVDVDLTQPQESHDVLARIWARRKIEDLMQQSYYQDSPAIEEAVTAIALDYELMTQYTSFVAVDEKAVATPGEPPVRMAVPVPLPEGAVWEGFFDELQDLAKAPVGDFAAAAAPTSSYSLMRRSPRPQVSRLALQQRLSRGKASQVRLHYALGGRVSGPRRLQRLNESLGSFGVTHAARPSGRGSSATRALSTRGYASESRFAFRDAAGTTVVTNPKSTKRRRDLLDQLGHELQKHLQSDQLAVAQATLTAIRVLQQYVTGEPPASVKQAPSPVDLHRRELQVWRKRLPSLDRRLSLQLRNAPINKALDDVSRAARIKIRLEDGASDDVKRLLNREQVNVEFFDANDKTVWQTLDAILYPLKFEWYVANDKQVVVTTGRRRQNPSIWIYDVGPIAVPTPSEAADPKDPAKVSQVQTEQLERFSQLVQKELNAEPDTVDWLGFGQLMVYGSHEQHEKMSRLIDALSGSGEIDEPGLKPLAELSRKRLASREKGLAKSRHDNRLQYIETLHRDASWALVADAASGRFDSHAFTQLQIAWSDPIAKKLLDDDARRLLMARSYWAARQAANWMPQNQQLKQLADDARTQIRPILSELTASLDQHTTDQNLMMAAIFGAMAETRGSSDDLPQLSAQLEPIDDSLAQLTAAIAGRPVAIHQTLEREIDKINSPEMILLVALACHAQGGSAWEWFRAHADELMGSQPLPGEMIVLVNAGRRL